MLLLQEDDTAPLSTCDVVKRVRVLKVKVSFQIWLSCLMQHSISLSECVGITQTLALM